MTNVFVTKLLFEFKTIIVLVSYFLNIWHQGNCLSEITVVDCETQKNSKYFL